MNENKAMLLQAAKVVLESAQTMQKGKPIGKDAMNNFTRFSASVHSFTVYTFIDASFEESHELKAFQEAINRYTEHYAELRNLIDVRVNQKEALDDFNALQEVYEQLEKAFV